MKKFASVLSVSALLMVALVVISGCKKKEDPIVPAFTITATTVNLQAGGLGLQFFAKCNNDDVKMTKVTIGDPIGSGNTTYNLNGTYFLKDQIFALQGDNEAYTKSIGTWRFQYVGNRTADGASFTVDGTLGVSK